MDTKTFKIVYFEGERIDLSTKFLSGTGRLEGQYLIIDGPSPHRFLRSEIKDMELFRQHGLGRMLRFSTPNGRFFMTVVRLNLFGYFVIINFWATGKLFKTLRG